MAKKTAQGFNDDELGGESRELTSEQGFEATLPTEKTKRPKGKYLASGGDIHNFEKEPVFVGRYTGRNLIREKDAENGDGKKGDIMGYYFESPDGVPAVIGNSYQIEKAVSQIVIGDVIYVEFLGKKVVGNKNVNQFDVILLDTVEERSNFGF